MFGALLGYPVETLWLYKDVSGNELVMRRGTSPDGATVWHPAPLTLGAVDGTLVHLAGADVAALGDAGVGRQVGRADPLRQPGRTPAVAHDDDVEPDAALAQQVAQRGRELARAVANAKFSAATRFEGTRQLAHESVAAALLNDGTPSLSERLAKIDGVDAAAVSSLAASLLKSKPTTTALGALKQLPYAEELL